MLQFKLFDLNVAGVVRRFYLMMAVTAVFGFINLWTLTGILAFVVAVSFILGISVIIVKPKKTSFSKLKGKPNEKETTSLRKAA